MVVSMKKWLSMTLTGTAFAVASSAALGAPDWPGKPITIVVPYATGGTADMLARFAAQSLQQALGQTVIVETKAGAGGSIGTEYVARAHPDGYTLIFTASGTMAVNPHVYKLRYKPEEDIAQITTLVDLPFVVVTNPAFPASNLQDFVAYARANPKSVTFGNAGMGTQQHMTQLMFAKAAGIDINIISYKGSIPAMNDLLGGHIQAVLDNTGVQTPFIQSKKVNALFITTPKRIAALPEVPTAEEAGLKGFTAVAWFGLGAPKGTPPEILNRVQQAIAQSYATPEMQKRLNELGIVPVANTPAEATARVAHDFAQFGEIAREINLVPM